ncbi:MAG TPA: protein translocase subunit SecF, partial [Candidatus Moranbacteria bacterium]|nr:protein translocase subunit SecF [Candidatus Moranbacteria bacterium]
MYQIINKRKYTYIISAVLIVLSVTALSVWGLRLGIDFKGGTLMEVQFSEDKVPASQDIQDKLSEFELDSLIIQPSENNVVILRYIASDDDLNSKVLGKIKEFDENVTQLRVDFIGASVSDQLKGSAVKALIFAIFGIALYIAWAFRKVSYPVPSWQYGLGAVIALAHDIIITLGAFAFLGKFYGVEVGIPFVAALLTILGYSVNDTIVVYDRTRENILRYGRKENFEETVNKSVNETLARSINTSLTVIVVLLAIIFFGGETIKYFSIALLIGVGFGTY